LFRQVERFGLAGAIGRRLGNACLFNADDDTIGAAMICKAIRARDVARVRQNLFDNLFATSISTTILDR